MLPTRLDIRAGEIGDRKAAEVELAVLEPAFHRDGVRLDAAGAQHVGAERQRHLLDLAGRHRLAGEELGKRPRLHQVGAVGAEIDGDEVAPGLREAPDVERAASSCPAPVVATRF